MKTQTRKFMSMIMMGVVFWAQINVSEYSPEENPGTCNFDGSESVEGITVASDDLPIGAKVYINNHEYTVLAKMGNPSVNKGKLDIFVNSRAKALEFGRQYLMCRIEIGDDD